MLTLVVDTSEGRRRFDLLIESFKDLDPVLREFDRFKRGKIDELFASGGNGEWPERSDRSEQRGWGRAIDRAGRAPHTLLTKLRREYGRALVRKSDAFRGGMETDLANMKRVRRQQSAQNTVARRAFVLKEFERQVEGGRLDVATFEGDDRRLTKSVRGLQERLDRAHSRAQQSGNTLGNIPRTIRSTIKGGTLTIDSSWESPAPLALNDGAKVGRGAELPPRPFLFWDESDVEYLLILLRQRALLAWGQ